MNLLHPLSEPVWLSILIIAVCVAGVSLVAYSLFAYVTTPPEKYDALRDCVGKLNKHARIKAEYDEHG